jgi:predicted nucleic acid-binding protein
VIVIDTNIMVYLLSGEGPRAQCAEELLRSDPAWTGPPILMSELRNVLVGSVRRGLIEPSDALAMQHDAALILSDRVVGIDGAEVVRTGLESDLTAYDAEFVVLARALGTTLVTEDREILRAAPDVARPLMAST